MQQDSNRLLGSWTLQSWRRIASDGTATHPHTEQGTGRLIYAPQGKMCGFLMSPLHARREAGDGQPQFVAYSGAYEVVDGIALHRVDFASDLRMLSKVLRRRIEWAGPDTLKLITLAAEGASDRESAHELTWRRDPS
jgi:hypothetical protein